MVGGKGGCVCYAVCGTQCMYVTSVDASFSVDIIIVVFSSTLGRDVEKFSNNGD